MRSQPACWRQAADMARTTPLPGRGRRVAIVGCGTSFHVSQAIAAWREAAGHGETDAFTASEMPRRDSYDGIVVVSRSGTTSEDLWLIESVAPGTDVIGITAVPHSPIASAVREAIVLPFADEQAIVQTRFATSVLALWRAHLGHDIEQLARLADQQLSDAVPAALARCEQFVFLGRGPGAGLANEASLKFREAALAWSESYPAMEFRHGPISVIGPRTLVWSLGQLADGLAEEIAETGAALVKGGSDPMVELVHVHRAAIALARARGLDPNNPRRLSRSVVLR